MKVSVYVGIVDRISGPAIWGIEVTDQRHFILHEDYTLTNIRNDIALIRLVSTIKSDPNVAIVQLPSHVDRSVVLDGKLATITGFGKSTDLAGPSHQLQWVRTLIAPNSVCEKTFGKVNVMDTNLCLDTTGGRSSCQGDSGGGLTLEINGRLILAGIVSYGAAASCTSNHPAVYTRVTSYLDWIQEKTNIHVE